MACFNLTSITLTCSDTSLLTDLFLYISNDFSILGLRVICCGKVATTLHNPRKDLVSYRTSWLPFSSVISTSAGYLCDSKSSFFQRGWIHLILDAWFHNTAAYWSGKRKTADIGLSPCAVAAWFFFCCCLSSHCCICLSLLFFLQK